MEQLDSAFKTPTARLNCNLTSSEQQILGPRQTYYSQKQLESFYGPLKQNPVNQMFHDNLEQHAALVG